MVTISSEDNRRWWVLSKTLKYPRHTDDPLSDLRVEKNILEGEKELFLEIREKLKRLSPQEEFNLRTINQKLDELNEWEKELEEELKYREKLGEVV
jgi:hypothetical protein